MGWSEIDRRVLLRVGVVEWGFDVEGGGGGVGGGWGGGGGGGEGGGGGGGGGGCLGLPRMQT